MNVGSYPTSHVQKIAMDRINSMATGELPREDALVEWDLGLKGHGC